MQILRVAALILALSFAACARHIRVTPPIIVKSTWAYAEDSPGQFRVFVANKEADAEMKATLCNPVVYVCRIEEAGKMYFIDRYRK